MSSLCIEILSFDALVILLGKDKIQEEIGQKRHEVKVEKADWMGIRNWPSLLFLIQIF